MIPAPADAGFSTLLVDTALGPMSCADRPGSDEPVVLLHGVGGHSGVWRHQAGAIGRQRLVAWDAPGYGRSFDFEQAAPSVSDYAAALDALLDRLGLNRVAVIGHSFGGLVAAAFAAARPDRVSRLVLAACSSGHATYEAARRQRLLAERLQGFTGEDPAAYARARVPRLLSAGASSALIGEAVALMSAIRLPGFHQANRMISSADIFRHLPHVQAPTLVVCGTADEVTPPSLNQRIAAALPRARFVAIDGAGHWLFLESPAAFNSAVESFVLTEHDPFQE